MATAELNAAELNVIATDLRFPEGPIAMPDGSVVVVEMFGPRLTRVRPDGSTRTLAEIPGGPNGAAVGPDGAIYVCNNGGCFTPVELQGLLFPVRSTPRRTSVGGSSASTRRVVWSPTCTRSATLIRCGRRTTS